MAAIRDNAFVRVGGNDPDTVRPLLADRDGVEQVLTKQQIKTEIVRARGQVTQILQLGSLVSIGVALPFVVACLGHTITRRKDGYQVMRVLGFRDGVIRLTIMAETCVLGLAAVVLATPVGALTAAYMTRKLSEAWSHVDTVIRDRRLRPDLPAASPGVRAVGPRSSARAAGPVPAVTGHRVAHAAAGWASSTDGGANDGRDPAGHAALPGVPCVAATGRRAGRRWAHRLPRLPGVPGCWSGSARCPRRTASGPGCTGNATGTSSASAHGCRRP